MRHRAGWAGQVAVVTGGASGIGLALGRRLHQLGAQVTLADLDGESARRAASAIGDGVDGRTVDVTDADAFRALVDDVVAQHGRIDVLVNNAGLSLGGPTHELSAAHWDRLIDVNLRGVVHGVLAAYPRMVAQGHGTLVNTASGAGLVAPPFVAAYAATKHAVVGLSTALRPEAALHGVRVSVLCPGAVETPILDARPHPDLPATVTGPVTAREYLGVVRQRPMAADAFAERALAAVARGRGIVVVPAGARPLWYLHRLSPALALHATRLVARRVDRELVQPRRTLP